MPEHVSNTPILYSLLDFVHYALYVQAQSESLRQLRGALLASQTC
jgi:hypothetical protein